MGVAVLAALLPLAAPLSASAASRVALVVGNGAYTHASRLPNPANDASDMAAALRRLGFEVTIARDAGRTDLNEALRAFTRRSATADVALVFYAGHAMEMDGVNYLLPVDARVERDTDVRYETVTLDDVLASTSGAGLRVVILDACRNNPLARSMQRTVSTRSVSNGSLGDLNEDLLGDETLVAYSAAAGTTADDGEGRNSPYTTALLAHLEEPVEIGLLFRRVREGVLTATSGRQRPHEYQSLLREHYLSVSGGGEPAVVAGGTASSAGVAAAARGPAAAGSAAALMQQETVFWQSIVNSTNRADFEAYLARWPAGVYAPLARGRVAALRSADPPRSDPPQWDPSPVRRAGDVFRDCDTCPEMVVVPAGEFMMGSPSSEQHRNRDEGPQHRVTIEDAFAVGVYEVTIQEWAACVRAGRCDGEILEVDIALVERYDPYPIVSVSFQDARTYVSWLSEAMGRQYRLLSEAEWEYVARAGTTGARYWGADPAEKYANWYDGRFSSGGQDGHQFRSPVGSYAPNGFGLYDVLGNAAEWVEDCWHGNYNGAPVDGTAWLRGGECKDRGLRGGCFWRSHRELRSADRRKQDADDGNMCNGFRVARTLDNLGGSR